MSNTQPDIEFGPGDTAPIQEAQLFQPDDADTGEPGPPQDLTGATAVFEYQVQDHTVAVVIRAVDIALGTDGKFALDLLETGGPVPPGDYWARFIFQLPGGYQVTMPVRGGGHEASPDQSFLWLHVSPDFITVV